MRRRCPSSKQRQISSCGQKFCRITATFVILSAIGDRNVVVMAATRSGIPIKWTSEQIIDREKVEVRFNHLKAFTKGMDVVWTFRETPDGVLVEIVHDLRFQVKLLAPLADKIIGDFFIHNIANKTLRCMKAYVEGRWLNQ